MTSFRAAVCAKNVRRRHAAFARIHKFVVSRVVAGVGAASIQVVVSMTNMRATERGSRLKGSEFRLMVFK